MSKAIEQNQLKATIKRFVQYFNLYWKFMCAVKNDDKNKMDFSPPSFHSFLTCWKGSQSTKTLKFSDFSLFCEKLRVIAWVDYFV